MVAGARRCHVRPFATGHRYVADYVPSASRREQLVDGLQRGRRDWQGPIPTQTAVIRHGPSNPGQGLCEAPGHLRVCRLRRRRQLPGTQGASPDPDQVQSHAATLLEIRAQSMPLKPGCQHCPVRRGRRFDLDDGRPQVQEVDLAIASRIRLCRCHFLAVHEQPHGGGPCQGRGVPDERDLGRLIAIQRVRGEQLNGLPWEGAHQLPGVRSIVALIRQGQSLVRCRELILRRSHLDQLVESACAIGRKVALNHT